MMDLDAYIRGLAVSMDPAVEEQFGPIERTTLKRAFIACQMDGYPAVKGAEEGYRASGQMICKRCGEEYFAHPMDWRVIGYGNVPFLNVLCDGRRMKL